MGEISPYPVTTNIKIYAVIFENFGTITNEKGVEVYMIGTQVIVASSQK